MGRRTERLSAQILKEVSGILSFMKDPRLGFLTLHRVDLTDDLSVAKIFVSTMGDDAEVKSTWCCIDVATMRPARLARDVVSLFLPN